MTQRTIVQLIDDIDGTEADETITFALDGVTYEMDLTDKHADELRTSLQKWISAARRTGRAQPAAASRRRGLPNTPHRDLDKVRAWAREHGHTVSDRGRVAATILDAYDAAH